MGKLTCLTIFILGIDDASYEQEQTKQTGNSSAGFKRSSLSKIILSLDSNVAKQQALQHVLTALQVCDRTSRQ